MLTVVAKEKQPSSPTRYWNLLTASVGPCYRDNRIPVVIIVGMLNERVGKVLDITI
jgi:hypothetical protein